METEFDRRERARIEEQLNSWFSHVEVYLGIEQKEDMRPRQQFLHWLMNQVAEQDPLITNLVVSLEGNTRKYLESVGGSVESPAGRDRAQSQFEGLWTIYQAGVDSGQ